MPVLHYRHHTGSGPVDLNKTAIFEGTAGVRPSAPLHVGAVSQAEEFDRLQTSYNNFHNLKLVQHDRRRDICSKPSSYKLMAGTNEFAEDLTGQRMPVNASQWRSETRDRFHGTQSSITRPISAPVRRVVSLMDNQEPVFGKTAQYRDPQLQEVYPHKPIVPSMYNAKDMYLTSYGSSHRKFAQEERMTSSYWSDKQKRQEGWLRDPVTSKRLQNRVPQPAHPAAPDRNLEELGGSNLRPNEAQVATLPHYTDPQLLLGKTENQMSYNDPYRAPDFYFEEPNTTKKPVVQHLERSFIN